MRRHSDALRRNGERGCVEDQPQRVRAEQRVKFLQTAIVLGLAASLGFRLNTRVSQPPEPRRPGPPLNSGVRDLVEGKRHSSSSRKIENLKRGFCGWHERGYLPHRDEPGLTQFVTFRLADSFPESLRAEWGHLWKIEDDQQRRTELEAYLDRGRGECYLHKPEIARLVEEAMRFFHGERYDLRAWTVMPNHVHALFKVDAVPMAGILESWKKYTAQKANRLLKRRGDFWQADYWDTYIRNGDHELQIRKYIESNPAKAGLVLDPKRWPWSSTRFRNEYGILKF